MLPYYIVVETSPDQVDFSIEELLTGVDFAKDRSSTAKRPMVRLKLPRMESFDLPVDAPPVSPKNPITGATREKPPSLLSRAITGFRNSTKSFNPSIGGMIGEVKNLFSKPIDEGNSPEVAAKNKRLQTYTSHMDTVRRELDPLKINDVWNTPLHKHGELRQAVLGNETKLDTLENSFKNALPHIESPTSKKMLDRKLEEIGLLRFDLEKHKEEHPDLPPLEMMPDVVKGRKGAINEYRKEGREHLEKGGDHKSLVEHLMRKYGLAEKTAKRHSTASHRLLKDQLKMEQEAHEKWIEDYMRNHLDLPIAPGDQV